MMEMDESTNSAGRAFTVNKALGLFFTITGVILLLISLLGDIVHIGSERVPGQRKFDKFDVNLAARTHSVADLIAEAHNSETDYPHLNEEKKMLALYNVVGRRFHHGLASHT